MDTAERKEVPSSMKAIERLRSAIPRLRRSQPRSDVPVRTEEPPRIDTFGGLHRAVEDLLEKVEREEAWWPLPAPSHGEPRWGVAEDDEGYTLRVELPGYEPGEVDVSVAPDRVTIRGVHHEETGKFWRWWRPNEWSESESHVSLDLPVPAEVDPTAATAELRRGVLWLHMPKSEAAKRRIRRIRPS